MKTLHQLTYMKRRSVDPDLKDRPNPNPHDHHNEETWKIWCDWESKNPNSDTYQKNIWTQTSELKELNILRLWERKNLITLWNLNYESITEIYINKVLELNSDKLSSLTTKKEKMDLIFGNWREERTTFDWNLTHGFDSLYSWIMKNLKFIPFDVVKDKKEEFIMIIIVDYILVRKGLKPTNRGGKFGFTHRFISDVEELYERWINC